MSSPEFQIACEQDSENTRYNVTLSGEIDFAAVPAVRDFILALDGDVEVNCEGVSFIDSSGLGLFVRLANQFDTTGHHIALRNLSGNCYRLFEMTGLVGHATRAEAP